MALRIAINGFGRIGRLVFRAAVQRRGIQIAAINDLADAESLGHLLKYDSVHGRFGGKVRILKSGLVVNKQKIKLLCERDPEKLPWKEMGVDVAVESTGIFRTREACQKHLDAGAKKVLLSAPPKSEIDAVIVLGVNDRMLKKSHKVVSNASCTTNCLAPMTKVIDDTFGVKAGMMTTIHAFTNDQTVTDLIHSDLRRARAAAVNIIPTTTGAAKAIGLVMPHLNGKMDGLALRVPVVDGSIVDLVCETKKKVDVDKLHAAMQKAASGPMKGILEFCKDPIVSSDVIGNSHSSIFDSLATMTLGSNMIKTLAWYDNEWGYSCRMVDLILKLKAYL